MRRIALSLACGALACGGLSPRGVSRERDTGSPSAEVSAREVRFTFPAVPDTPGYWAEERVSPRGYSWEAVPIPRPSSGADALSIYGAFVFAASDTTYEGPIPQFRSLERLAESVDVRGCTAGHPATVCGHVLRGRATAKAGRLELVIVDPRAVSALNRDRPARFELFVMRFAEVIARDTVVAIYR